MDCSPLGSSAIGFSRQEHWTGLPFPSPGDLSDPGIEPAFPAGGFFTADPTGKPDYYGYTSTFLVPVIMWACHNYTLPGGAVIKTLPAN